ncbi:MAG: GspE/PulE family protein [Planctomycetota bacterium]
MRDHDVFLERALLDAERVTIDQMETARSMVASERISLADALIATETLTGRQIALCRADICEVPFINLDDYEPSFGNTALLPRSVAERFNAFPLFLIEGVLTVAMEDPLNLEATDQIRQIANCDVDTVLAETEQIQSIIARSYTMTDSSGVAVRPEEEDEQERETDTEPIVAAVNQLVIDAINDRASDIHINPDEHELHLRYRVDGVLHRKQGPSLSMHPGLVQRLKVMANLDLTQTRRPQDGKFRFRHGNQLVDVRMSTLPTVCGENVVLRLLASNQSVGDFHALGMPAPLAETMEELIHQPYGIFLVTGPTGSGKTTTLYSVLSKLNEPSRNIMTIEDPVEIRMPYVRQVQVHSAIGMTFAATLRSILRQDPDVVLVGEVRDEETATIALQAALTGHLVLSTLHTNDAAGAVSRLRDYGLPPFVINSAVLGVLAQRLVRRVCQHCLEAVEPTELLRERFRIGDDSQGFVKGNGCNRCGQTGFRGRVGIYELLKFTSGIRHLVEENASIEQLRVQSVKEGMRLMWQDGLEKARLGLTTLDEISKVATVVDVPTRSEVQKVSA